MDRFFVVIAMDTMGILLHCFVVVHSVRTIMETKPNFILIVQ